MKKRTGTREWSQRTVNIQRGCEYSCRYCFAREQAIRFRRCSAEQWSLPAIDQAKVDKGYRFRPGVTMFPSTHDVTQTNIEQCLEVLEKLLASGNEVLIVSKPSWKCIPRLCDRLGRFRQQILFRFTIGSNDSGVLKFWEPGAPGFTEREDCLCHATDRGFRTSVSCEPYLDANIRSLFCELRSWVTECIWIGTLRNFKRRVDLTGVTEKQMEKYVKPLQDAQTPAAVQKLYQKLCMEQKVRWKDSIREIVGPTDETDNLR